jgi:hypothetical protein
MPLHRFLDLDGSSIFYREAGGAEAPALLLPHGYPCSSFAYRHLLPALADEYRLIAPTSPAAATARRRTTFDMTSTATPRFSSRFSSACVSNASRSTCTTSGHRSVCGSPSAAPS